MTCYFKACYDRLPFVKQLSFSKSTGPGIRIWQLIQQLLLHSLGGRKHLLIFAQRRRFLTGPDFYLYPVTQKKSNVDERDSRHCPY